MSGETESRPSAWNVDTLHSHLSTLLEERSQHWNEIFETLRSIGQEADRRYDVRFVAIVDAAREADKRFEQRFIAQQEAIQAALLAQKEAVNAALVAADRAVVKAETASEKRFDAVNEFRATLADQAAQLMPRAEAEARIQALADKLSELSNETRNQDDRLREQHQRDIVTIRDEFTKGLGTLSTVQTLATGRDRGIGLSWGILIAAVGLLAGLGGLFLAIVKP